MNNISVRTREEVRGRLGVSRTVFFQPTNQHGDWRARLLAVIGIFLIVLTVYVLTSPGRIDIIDGQYRYEAAYNWLVEGRPVIRDPYLQSWRVPGRFEASYSLYGAPASVLSMPLVWLGASTENSSRETSRFLFSLTTPLFGGLVAVVMLLFYQELGLSTRSSIGWTVVSSFATMMWPSSCTTFENAQRSFFALTAVYLGVLSLRRNSRMLAFLGGLVASVLVLYQEYHVLIIPAMALCTLRWSPIEGRSTTGTPQSWWSRLVLIIQRGTENAANFARRALRDQGEERESCFRFLLWSGTAVVVGLALSFSYNHLRFGTWIQSGRMERASPFSYMGEPISGFSTLILSPGKSIFLFSPPLILGILGLRRLGRRQPSLVLAMIAASVILVSMLSFISFPGGDWCWGPRYLVVLLPLWSLPLPFLVPRTTWHRSAIAVLLGIGLMVQVLALSTENQRFFFAHGFNDYFYMDDPWVYFKHSALLDRFSEVASLKEGVPATARFFTSAPVPRWSTYAIFGPSISTPRSEAPDWMRNFKIYYLPRPWPLWMRAINPALRPIPMREWLFGLGTMLLAGVVCLGIGLGLDIRSKLLFSEIKLL